MSSIRLDLRNPVLVVTGIFNPAIFNPPWMGAHLFGFEAGSTINFAIAEGVGAGGGVAFLNGVGISVSRGRLELFASAEAEEILVRVEQIAKAIFEKLPHTPFGALGVNFSFFDPEPDENIEDIFQTGEKLEAHFQVSDRQITTKIVQSADRQKNLNRSLSDSGFHFSVNNHHMDINIANASRLIDGSLKRELDDAIALCNSLYGYNSHTVEVFDLPDA